jgi:phospholipase C
MRHHPATHLIAALAALALLPAGAAAYPRHHRPLRHVKHLVVLYLENHSFDNLYGAFPGANGRAQADPAHTTQVDLDGRPLGCLPQTDVNLTSPPLSTTCTDGALNSHFFNRPFQIDAPDLLPPEATTCPPPDMPPPGSSTGVPKGSGLPGGCTRDLVHRYYQNRVQIDGGRNDKFAVVSDAKGLTMGYYDTSRLPLVSYARRYTLADDFFQGAIGGSFLNHQWLIAARTPEYPGAARDGGACDIHSVLGPNGLPTKDAALTAIPDGDWAVNTIQPINPPYRALTPDCQRLPAQTHATIGDRLSHAGVSWAWYSGGWNDAEAGHPAPLFQFHHQPFAYFARYAPGRAGRRHLRDETEFVEAARDGDLPAVSFVKPFGKENEHPGYTDVGSGERHAVDLIEAVRRSPDWRSTAIVVTYDENGGFWDHVPPPVADRWGPGTRIPTLVISPWARRHHVDHTQYDTTSILATIERRWHLRPLTGRDARANDLRLAFRSSERG